MAKGRKGAIKPPSRPSETTPLQFSFRYVQSNHPKFYSFQNAPPEFLRALFLELERYSRFTVDQFRENVKAEHRHQIDFKQTGEPKGFPIEPTGDDLWTDEAWQFGLVEPGKPGEASLWRVHGFIYEGVFHVVWLDPGHDLTYCGPRGTRSPGHPKLPSKKKPI